MPAEMTAAHPDDAVLLAALRCGDSSAAGRMMQRHNRTLWRIARGVLGDDGEAKEAVQDTFLGVGDRPAVHVPLLGTRG